jgi:GT2 family glycosyltransferase
MKKKHVSVIILQYNKSEYTIECLKSIKKWFNSYNCTYDVIVVDNGSDEEHKLPLRKFQAEELPIEVLWNDTNLGFGMACNQGVHYVMSRSTPPDYVLLLNNDAMTLSGCIYSLIQCAESDDKIAVVGAQVLKPNTTFIHHTGVCSQSRGEEHDSKYNGIVDRYIRNHSQNVPRYMYEDRLWVNGCCMLIKTDVIKKHGLFDEEFFPVYFEEADFCIRLQKLGYRVVYNPMAKVYHHQRVTASALEGASDMFYRHWEKLVARHREWWLTERSNMDFNAVPRVNIIMPAYNAESTIAETLRCIQKQTYPNYKIIIVDDGSTDKTGEIATQFQKMYQETYAMRNSDDYGACQIERECSIMCIKQTNGGQSSARNTGIMHIEHDCDYIAYCDADDHWEPEHLERMVHFLQTNRQYDMVSSEAIPVNTKGEVLTSYGIPRFSQGGHYNHTCFLEGNPVFVSSVVHRPRLLLKTGGFDSHLDCIEDWYMWYKMARVAKCYYYPLKTIKYVVRDDGFAGKVTLAKQLRIKELIAKNEWTLPELVFRYYKGDKKQSQPVIESPSQSDTNIKQQLINRIDSMSETELTLLKRILG